MSIITAADIFLEKLLVNEYMIQEHTARFFTYLLEIFTTTETISSSSKKLGDGYRRNERTIRNYLKELREKNLLHVKPHRNQDDPKRPYIEYTIYSKTYRTKEVIEKLKYWKQQQRNVFFIPEDSKQAKKNNHRRY